MAEVESSNQYGDERPNRRKFRTAIVLLCISCFVVFILLVPMPIQGRALNAIGDMAHAPLFGSITLSILLMIRMRSLVAVPFGIVLSVATAVFVFGVGIEFTQSLSGRMASLHDVVANGLGIIVGVTLFFATVVCKDARTLAFVLSLSALGVMAFAWSGPMSVLLDVAKAKSEFPMLATFDSSAEFGRLHFHQCKPRLVKQDATDGRYAMEIAYSSLEKFPGARMDELEQDWSNATSLEIDLALDESYSPGKCELMINVVDNQSWNGSPQDEHFWLAIELSSGEVQHVSISRQELIDGPKSRKLNLREIAGIDLIAIEPSETVRIRVDAIRLVLE